MVPGELATTSRVTVTGSGGSSAAVRSPASATSGMATIAGSLEAPGLGLRAFHPGGWMVVGLAEHDAAIAASASPASAAHEARGTMSSALARQSARGPTMVTRMAQDAALGAVSWPALLARLLDLLSTPRTDAALVSVAFAKDLFVSFVPFDAGKLLPAVAPAFTAVSFALLAAGGGKSDECESREEPSHVWTLPQLFLNQTCTPSDELSSSTGLNRVSISPTLPSRSCVQFTRGCPRYFFLPMQ